jgi:ATP-binding cassette subfamily B protein
MAASDDGGALTIYDCQPDEAAKVDVRRLPRMVGEGMRIVWAAGRGDFLVSATLQAAGGFGIVLLLLLAQRALSAIEPAGQGSLGDVFPWAAGLGAVAGVQLLAASVQRERQQILGERVSRHVEERVLDVTAAVELAAFETPSFHNRVQRVRSQTHQPLNLVFGVSGFGSAFIGLLSVAIALLTIEPLLIPLVLLVLIPAWLVASRRGEAFYRFFWRMTPRDRERRYLAHLLADRDAAKEVRSFGLEPYLRGRYERLYDERLAELRTVAHRQVMYAAVANLAIGVLIAGTLLLVAWLTFRDRVSLAEAGVAIAGIAVAGGRLAGAGFAAGALAEASLYIEDYRAFLELAPPARTPATKGAPLPEFRRIDLEHVTFTYPSASEPAVVDVSMHIEAGEVVALVGENGSGKTTLAKLLARLFTPDEGGISWDGIDVQEVDPELLRSSIAVIFQDFLRYHLQAKDNVGLGRVSAIDDLAAIMRSSRHAGADGFLEALPAGYETMLGPQFEGGTDLSTGQWQRVALARAFFRDAPFVILDEPTAALDARAEHDLFERIRSLLAGRTVLLISHRFSSVRSADRIYVLDEGRVVEDGTHDELMDSEGLYAELFTLQAAAYFAPETALGRRNRTA